MIKNFLIMDCIGNDDRLGLRINKDFFIYNFKIENNVNETLVKEVSSFLKKHNVKLDETFSIIVNQGPGSFQVQEFH